jgi:preprotein translocase subunit SecA
MRNFLTKIFGDPNEASLKPFQQVVGRVNALEPQMEALSDLELRELANGFRDRLEDGESMADLQPESFAATREAARRAGTAPLRCPAHGRRRLARRQDRRDAHR